MWEALAQIGLYLGIDQAGKLLNDISSVSPAEASGIAARIISAAEKKGQSMLTKAMQIINNIPAIAGSPTVKQAMIKARQEAENNYDRVEKSVNDLRSKANDSASNVEKMANESVFTKATKWMFGKGTAKNRINNEVNSINNAIEDWKVEEEV